AERERQDGEAGEGLVGRHRAPGVAQVGRERVEPGDDPDLPRVLSGQRRVAELPARAQGGGFAGHALGGLLALEHLAMEVHLLAQLPVEALAAEEEEQLVAQAGPHGQIASMIAAIAPVMRSKPSASWASRFRPAGVM